MKLLEAFERLDNEAFNINYNINKQYWELVIFNQDFDILEEYESKYLKDLLESYLKETVEFNRSNEPYLLEDRVRKIKINFDGGDLSSDAGLLLIKEFVSKLGIDKLFSQSFKTNDSALFRYHTDKANLLQMIYMIIAGYFKDDTSDEITNDPVFKAVLNKGTLITTNHFKIS